MMQPSNPAANSEPSANLASAESWNAYVEDFAKSAHQTVDWIAGFLRETRRYPVLPSLNPGELIDALPAHAPLHGEPFSRILRDFEQQVLPAVTHWNHPGFFAYFATTGSTPAILADMLSAALNTNGLHWKTSPAVAELEHVTLAWLREWIGLPPEFFGIIYDTASTTSMHALVAAREFKHPEARVEGSTPTWWFTPRNSRILRSKRERSPSASGRRTCARFPSIPNSACAPMRSPGSSRKT